MKTFAFAALLSLAMTVPSQAGFEDGNKLYSDCISDNYYNNGLCLGFILGSMDTFEDILIKSGKADCLPVGTKAGQLEDAVRIYLRDHPAERSYPAHQIVIAALMQAWGCTGPRT